MGGPGVSRRGRKKKALSAAARDLLYRSALVRPGFRAPESHGDAFGAELAGSEGEGAPELEAGLVGWDLATRYHELKTHAKSPARRARLRRRAGDAVLARAREALGSVSRPLRAAWVPWPELPPGAIEPEIDVEASAEEAAFALLPEDGPRAERGGGPGSFLDPREIVAEFRLQSPRAVVLAVDTSLSMTGEKLALTAVALAVVLLQFPEDPVGIVAFENDAKVIKRPEERLPVEILVQRFLDVPAQGYTHLEAGAKAALGLARGIRESGYRRLAPVVLLTDGKYTAGRDPAYLAPLFSQLEVLKMGSERASLPLCRELAHRGRGSLRVIGDLRSLPGAMVGVVRDLLRAG